MIVKEDPVVAMFEARTGRFLDILILLVLRYLKILNKLNEIFFKQHNLDVNWLLSRATFHLLNK